MAAKVLLAEDEYIDMEVTSYSNFLFCHNSLTSSPNPREEFEFQMSSSSIFQHKEPSSTSPADLLFYKGKLLPLHLLQNSKSLNYHSEKDYAFGEYFYGTNGFWLSDTGGISAPEGSELESQSESKLNEKDEFYSTPLTTTNTTPTTITPFESCTVSPSQSCRVSRDLNLDEYDFEFDCLTNYTDVKTKRKKNSSLGSKLRSWFGKASCKYEAYVTKVADEGSVSNARESLNNKHVKVAKKNPFGQIHRHRFQSSNSITDMDTKHNMKYGNESNNRQGRSLAEGIKGVSRSKASLSGSSSFSVHPNKSNGCQELQLSKGNSEIGNSILAAIAHCKQSQQYFN